MRMIKETSLRVITDNGATISADIGDELVGGGEEGGRGKDGFSIYVRVPCGSGGIDYGSRESLVSKLLFTLGGAIEEMPTVPSTDAAPTVASPTAKKESTKKVEKKPVVALIDEALAKVLKSTPTRDLHNHGLSTRLSYSLQKKYANLLRVVMATEKEIKKMFPKPDSLPKILNALKGFNSTLRLGMKLKPAEKKPVEAATQNTMTKKELHALLSRSVNVLRNKKGIGPAVVDELKGDAHQVIYLGVLVQLHDKEILSIAQGGQNQKSTITKDTLAAIDRELGVLGLRRGMSTQKWSPPREVEIKKAASTNGAAEAPTPAASNPTT